MSDGVPSSFRSTNLQTKRVILGVILLENRASGLGAIGTRLIGLLLAGIEMSLSKAAGALRAFP